AAKARTSACILVVSPGGSGRSARGGSVGSSTGFTCRSSGRVQSSDRFLPYDQKPMQEEHTRVLASEAKTRPQPTHVTLAAVLQVRGERLEVLLWQRAKDPFAGAWALPGGYLAPGQTLEQSIRRHLAAKVDVDELSWLEQLETRSDPDRHPLEWQLATAYLGLVPRGLDPSVPADTTWHPVDPLP